MWNERVEMLEVWSRLREELGEFCWVERVLDWMEWKRRKGSDFCRGKGGELQGFWVLDAFSLRTTRRGWKEEKTWKLYAAAEDRRALGFKSPLAGALLLMERWSARGRAVNALPEVPLSARGGRWTGAEVIGREKRS